LDPERAVNETQQVILLDHLSKVFGPFEAVSDVSLRVERGEVFGFLGPNGAGKTTTMKMMMGLMRPTRGRVIIQGIDVSVDPVRARKRIGYVPDRPYLYEKLSAREFLVFIAGIYGLNPRREQKRMEELLEIFDLGDWNQELIESYSHGMKQRLTMAAAFLHQPEVLIVDEPMVGLDPRGAELVKSIFRRFSRSGHGTIFLSTHSMDVAEELCDRVAILHRGKILAEGTLQQLRERVGQGSGRLHELFLRLTGGVETGDGSGAFVP
jgi:ABC-2 type transport system ATP-binding protein